MTVLLLLVVKWIIFLENSHFWACQASRAKRAKLDGPSGPGLSCLPGGPNVGVSSRTCLASLTCPVPSAQHGPLTGGSGRPI